VSPDRITAAQYQELMAKRKLAASGAPGSAWRGAVAKPGEAFGLKFPSQVQLRTYQQLKYLYPNALIVREPILDLRSLAVEGKPGRYRPDFMVISLRPGLTGWVKEPFDVEIHEAKGSKGAESRDWRVRAAAALNEYPFIPMYVWRSAPGKTVSRVSLQEALKS
jgi:hypothetical protein